jgi:hypothetical protein
MELNPSTALPISRIDQLHLEAPAQRWLIHSLWAHEAVGILGGAPKCCKSWLGLDMAVSVASQTPCLGRFAVENPGPVLMFLAEDDLFNVRARCEAICAHRSLALQGLNLFSITASCLRLDLKEDQTRLDATLERLKPRLLLLDPLVRMHRLDENSSADISRILGFLRELQRRHHLAIVLVHHASKRQHSQPGQALRGSSDLHASFDSNAYLTRRQDRLVLTLEHRTARPIDPLELQLLTGPDELSAHLEVVSEFKEGDPLSLDERIKKLLKNNPDPLKRTHIRSLLKVNNQRLGNALLQLEKQGSIIRHANGYKEVETETGQRIDTPVSEQQLSMEAYLKNPSLEDSDAFH